MREVLLLVLLAATAAAQDATPVFTPSFSEDGVVIYVVDKPQGSARHGYGEYLFRVVNTTKSQRRVTLTMPAEEYGGDSVLTALSRRLELEPDASAVVSLYQPALPLISGQNVRVTIDGQVQKESIPLTIENIFRAELSSSRRARPGFSGFIPLVLVGPGLKKDAVESLQIELVAQEGVGPRPAAPEGRRVVPLIGAPGAIVGEVVVDGRRLSRLQHFDEVRLERSPRDWPSNWLSFSRYDAVLLSADDLRQLPEASRMALWQYVECGGVLWVAGTAQLAAGWQGVGGQDALVYQPGFGLCVVVPAEPAGWKEDIKQLLRTACSQTATPFRSDRTVIQANDKLPVVDDIGIPVRGLFVLMVVFVILIGPVNLTLLARWKKRLWLLWTVPAISAVTVLLVYGYMLVAEGWSRHQRTELLTIKDERSGRATTIGWTSFYSPITPGDGLRFRPDTELTLEGEFDDQDERRYGGRRRGSRSCTLEWGQDQHLQRGWLRARLPAHFLVRKNEARQERVLIRDNKDGTFTATNALGGAATITRLRFADAEGRLHVGEAIPPGGQQTLTNTGTTIEKASRLWRQLFVGDWLEGMRQLRSEPEYYLLKYTYLAEIEDTPFLEDGLEVRYRRCKSVVLGILDGVNLRTE